MQGYNSHGLSAHWEQRQSSRKSNDSREWKGLEPGKLTRWHDLPPRVKQAFEIIKFKEVRDLGFQSGLILTSRRYCPGAGNVRQQIFVLAMQADHMSSI